MHSGLASGHLWIWPLLKTIKWVSIPKSRHFQLSGTILAFYLFLILTELQYTELSQFYNFIIQRKFYNFQVKKTSFLFYSSLLCYYWIIIQMLYMRILIYKTKNVFQLKNPYFVTCILIPDLLTEIFIIQR